MLAWCLLAKRTAWFLKGRNLNWNKGSREQSDSSSRPENCADANVVQGLRLTAWVSTHKILWSHSTDLGYHTIVNYLCLSGNISDKNISQYFTEIWHDISVGNSSVKSTKAWLSKSIRRRPVFVGLKNHARWPCTCRFLWVSRCCPSQT